jgi:TPR repeat protein
MNRKVPIFILISILLLWTSPSIALVAEYQEAIDAYNREDYKTSYRLIRPLAKKGFTQAQYNLGVLYLKGKGVKVNLKKAIKLFEFAAEQGVVKAQNKLGLMYFKGMGVEQDFIKAIEWWHLAAAQGNGKAQTNLGWMYEMGKGVPKDVQKAANWYELASNQGIAIAQKKLNLLLDQTKKHLQEDNTNSKNFKSSEEIKNLHSIAASLRSELDQIKSEKANAIEAINQVKAKAKQVAEQAAEQAAEEAAEKASEVARLEALAEEAAAEMARIKAEETLQRAENQAAEELAQLLAEQAAAESSETARLASAAEEAAQQAENQATEELAQLLAEQVAAEASEAARLAAAAAEEAAAAQINFGLGVVFENGQGVPRDIKEAIRWYRLAADQGLIKAEEKLNLLLNKQFFKTVVNDKTALDTNQAIAKAKEVKLVSMKEFESLIEKNSIELKKLYTTIASLRSEIEQTNVGKTRSIESTNEAIALATAEKLDRIMEYAILKEKNSSKVKNLHTTITSLRSELEQINLRKTRSIEASNQAIAKAKEEKLVSIKEFESLKEKTSIEVKNLHTASASLRSELQQIKLEKIRAIEANNQAIAKVKKEKLVSIKEFKSLKEKTFTEVKNLHTTITSLRSELEQIKLEKARAIEAKNQAIKQLVHKHLEKWVNAWEKQNIELYLSFYSKTFKGSKEEYESWKASRQAALKKHTNISIQLQNIKISQSKNTIENNFIQTFKSDGYSDTGMKELVWIKNGSDWRIIKETWTPYR